MRSVPRTYVPVIAAMLVVMGTIGITAASSAVMADIEGEQSDPDNIVLDIHISGNETATWTIEHRYRLDDDNATEAFDALASDTEENEGAYIDRFHERMQESITNAALATGREMAMVNVSVETEKRALPQEYGIVRYTFEWEGFAQVTGDRIVVGDAIEGLFLDETSNLRISWDEPYELQEVTPEPNDRGDASLEWHGPVDFDEDEPALAFNGGEHPVVALSQFIGIVGVALLGLAIVAGGWWWLNTRETHTPNTDSDAADNTLLSNQERVLRLVEAEGGRMKQQEVVERLGWTDAKTSQVVSDLRADGALESFRLGRENVLRLPSEDADD